MLLSIDCLATMERIRTRIQRMGLGCSGTDVIQFLSDNTPYEVPSILVKVHRMCPGIQLFVIG